jgi:hypothetical protein
MIKLRPILTLFSAGIAGGFAGAQEPATSARRTKTETITNTAFFPDLFIFLPPFLSA